MENPIKMDDLWVVPLFSEISKSKHFEVKWGFPVLAFNIQFHLPQRNGLLSELNRDEKTPLHPKERSSLMKSKSPWISRRIRWLVKGLHRVHPKKFMESVGGDISMISTQKQGQLKPICNMIFQAIPALGKKSL